LLKHLLEYALARGVRELDFTIGPEIFKYRFANRIRWNYAVRVFRRRVDREGTRLLLAARKVVERLPPLERLARRILQRWRRTGG
jgi:hypothetical protein